MTDSQMTILRVDAVETGKLMRKALRKSFPDAKFSVRMSRGTAWGNFYISWTDGPTETDVGRVLDLFQGKDFDGMTDSTTYRPPVTDHETGKSIKYGAGLLLYSRTLSPGLKEALTAHVPGCYAPGTHEFDAALYHIFRNTPC